MARKPLTDEQKRKNEERTYTRRIRTTFENAGFTRLATADIEHKFGNQTGELDDVFIHQNIIIVSEDTISKTSKVKEHLKKKKILFDQIVANKGDFIDWLQARFPTYFAENETYAKNRYKVFFLYFAKNAPLYDDHDIALFEPIKLVAPATLNYLQRLAANIRLSSRAEFFRYLDLQAADLGTADSGSHAKTIGASIIYPEDNTGLKNGVKLVSFMMSAQNLLNNAYVLRKDNWEESIALYQRLIERDRIQKIRRYLATNQTSFINNIIVSLPDRTTFEDSSGKPIDPSKVETFTSLKMNIPNELNSICVIDGQHRIYAHYEGKDVLEPEVAKLRKKLHLLVTGLIFPDDMPDLERRTFESRIFLDINANAKTVPADVLLFIETLKDRYSDLGISRQILIRLNRTGVFKGLFQLSLMEESRIKTASIIKYALRYLVDLHEDDDRPTLFALWGDEKKRADLLKARATDDKGSPLLEEYVAWCAIVIDHYFASVRARFQKDWNDPTSKALSTTAINGFLIALRRSLPALGLLEIDEYHDLMKNLSVDFGPDFEYTSSQYAKFSRAILRDAFGLVDENETWIRSS